MNLFVVVIINNILVHFRSPEKHAQHLFVLQMLKEHRLYAKFPKCEFWLNKVSFLGHVAFEKRVQLDPSKIEAVEN